MEPAEYQRLHDFEDGYWWYLAQRDNLADAVADLNLPAGARILDAGCGTGRNLAELARRFSVTAYGVDVSPHAAALWNGEVGVRRCLASVNNLPYADGLFDAVCCVDVLGCEGVHIEHAINEICRVLRSGGHLVLLAPAYQWLLSPHDAAVHSVHRFTRSELRALADQAGLTVRRLSHCFPSFLPVIAATRLLGRAFRGTAGKSDLMPLPRPVNSALRALARAEHSLLRHVTVPFGTTILMVAQKEAA